MGAWHRVAQPFHPQTPLVVRHKVNSGLSGRPWDTAALLPQTHKVTQQVTAELGLETGPSRCFPFRQSTPVLMEHRIQR